MNYSDCIIYKITCKNPDIKAIYVGHTFNLNKRSITHKVCVIIQTIIFIIQNYIKL